MKRTAVFFLCLAVLNPSTFAQGYFSFYQLRELVPQSQSLQPAFVPSNSLTIGIPGFNFGTMAQADLKIEDLLSKDRSFDLIIDFDVIRGASKAINRINLDATANLIYIGLRKGKGNYSFFANTRATVDFQYGADLMELLANGNANRIGETIHIRDSRMIANAWHEIGLGYARKFLDDRLTVGARIKKLTGLFHGSLARGASGSILTDATDYSWEVSVNNGTINTAGLDFFFDDDHEDKELSRYLVGNANRGLAFDLGVKFRLLDYLTIEGSVNDLGSIRWKEEVRNYHTADTTVVFRGVQLRGLEGSSDVLQDSVKNKFRSYETGRAFSASLAAKSYLAASLCITPKDKVTLMAFNNHAFNTIDPSYALAYNHTVKRFSVGMVGSYRGNQSELNIGFNIVSGMGPVQLYFALDNALITNRPETYSKMDMRFGLNLIFGYKRPAEKETEVDPDQL